MRMMLTFQDREVISRGLVAGLQMRQIAAQIERNPPVVSREVSRGGGRKEYRAQQAQTRAVRLRRRPKTLAVDRSPRLRGLVTGFLRRGWSPASIAGRLPIDQPGGDAIRVSDEAIYSWVYARPAGHLARGLIALRSGRSARRGGGARVRAPHPRLQVPVDARLAGILIADGSVYASASALFAFTLPAP